MSTDATPNPQVALDDQLEAAARESKQLLARMAVTSNYFDPDRFPRSKVDQFKFTNGRKVAVIRALRGCSRCVHIETAGPRPVTAWLAVERIVCRECEPHLLDAKPPTEHDDRCDWCHTHGQERFTPITIQVGPVLIIGDACAACAEKMGCPA